MRNLYFDNGYGDRRVIAQCNTEKEVIQAIYAFIAKHNENRPAEKQFVQYYTRTWHQDNMQIYDVGSHNEFFLWED